MEIIDFIAYLDCKKEFNRAITLDLEKENEEYKKLNMYQDAIKENLMEIQRLDFERITLGFIKKYVEAFCNRNGEPVNCDCKEYRGAKKKLNKILQNKMTGRDTKIC